MRRPPGWRLPPELKSKVERARRVRGLITKGSEQKSEEPLKFGVPNIPLRYNEKWKKRKPKGNNVRPEGYDFRQVWRLKGKFTKRPVLGERAKML